MLSQIPWHRRLGFQLTAASVAVTVAIAAALGALGVRAQERQLVAIVVRGAALLSDTIKTVRPRTGPGPGPAARGRPAGPTLPSSPSP